MTTKKNDRPHLDLDRVLASRTPDFTLGGLSFEGRPIGWTVALEFDDLKPAEQVAAIVRALRSRCEDPDAMTDEWIEENLTRMAINAIVGMLFRGEHPQEAKAPEPNRAARRAASKSS